MNHESDQKFRACPVFRFHEYSRPLASRAIWITFAFAALVLICLNEANRIMIGRPISPEAPIITLLIVGTSIWISVTSKRSIHIYVGTSLLGVLGTVQIVGITIVALLIGISKPPAWWDWLPVGCYVLAMCMAWIDIAVALKQQSGEAEPKE